MSAGIQGVRMPTFVRLVFVAGMSLMATSATAGTFYKSIAPDGSVVYSDHPPPNAKVEKVLNINFEDLPSSPVPDLPADKSEKPKIARSQPAAPIRNDGVVLFSAVWCGYCKRAKAYLARKSIGYQNIDIDTASGRSAFAQSGSGGVPLLFNGARHIRGFTDAGYDAFFAVH